jgi:Tol biopolymer transport system component
MGRWLLLLAVAALPIGIYAWRTSSDAGTDGTAGGGATTRRDPEAANLYHLYVMPLNGGTAEAVPDPRPNPYLTFDPAWAPDGARLAVTDIDCHQCPPEVRIVALDRRLQNRRKVVAGSQPSFAPDGRTLAFVPADGGLATADLEGGGQRVLLEDESGSVNRPRFSPEGDRIAFMRQDRRGRWHVWTIRPTGGGLKQLTKGARPETDPAWTPDGERIAFARQAENGLWHIYVVARNGGTPRRITGLDTSDSYPSFTPDGRTIVFVRQDGSRFFLVQQRIGGPPRPLTTAPLRDAAEPTVSPRGDRVAFIARR